MLLLITARQEKLTDKEELLWTRLPCCRVLSPAAAATSLADTATEELKCHVLIFIQGHTTKGLVGFFLIF